MISNEDQFVFYVKDMEAVIKDLKQLYDDIAHLYNALGKEDYFKEQYPHLNHFIDKLVESELLKKE